MRWMVMGVVGVLLLGSARVWAEDEAKVPPPDPQPAVADPPQANPPADLKPAEMNPVGGAAASDEAAAAALRARYRKVNGEWWYWTDNKGWKIYRDGAWIDFDPATYQAPQAAVVPATSSSGGTTRYYAQPSRSYRSGPRVYIGTGFGYPGYGFGGSPYGYGGYPYGGSGVGIGFSFGGRRW